MMDLSALHDRLMTGAIECYFERLNAHDLDGVMAGLAETCEMRIPSSNFTYTGKAALRTHLGEFLGIFSTVHFRNYHASADPVNRTVGVYFDVHLRAHDDEVTDMQNANFFAFDAAGLITDILIFASAPLSKGFEAGSS